MNIRLAKRLICVAAISVSAVLAHAAADKAAQISAPPLATLAPPGAPSQRQELHPDPKFYIFLCFGQSNMEGSGQIEQADRTVDDRFQVLADFDNPSRGWTKGQWYVAVPPLTRRTSGISLVD